MTARQAREFSRRGFVAAMFNNPAIASVANLLRLADLHQNLHLVGQERHAIGQLR
jgi:hypothetical protein